MSDIKEQFQTWLETYPLDGELRKEEYDLMCDSYIAGCESQQAEITRLAENENALLLINIELTDEITRLNEVVKQNEIDAKRLAFISMNCELIKSNGTKGKEAKNLRYLREVIDQAMSEKGDK